MRSTIYLSLVLSLWSLFVSSLPLRSCLHPEPLDKDDVAPCTPIQPGTHDLPLGEGSPHRKARATDVLADTNTLSALKSRVALVKRATVNAEEFLRRNVESLFLKVGKGGNIADSRAGRSLKERWSISQGEWLDLTSYDPIGNNTGSTSRKRWTISPQGSKWNKAAVSDADLATPPST